MTGSFRLWIHSSLHDDNVLRSPPLVRAGMPDACRLKQPVAISLDCWLANVRLRVYQTARSWPSNARLPLLTKVASVDSQERLVL